MGCTSSKILTRTGSFSEEVKQRLQRVKGLELLASKNGDDKFLAILCNTNTVSRKLKAESPIDMRETNTSKPLKLIDLKTVDSEEPNDHTTNPPIELTDIENIDWELLDGAEDGIAKEGKEHALNEECSNAGVSSTSTESTEESKYNNLHSNLVPLEILNFGKENVDDGVARVRSFRTVEDYDAMLANNQLTAEGSYVSEGSENLIKECKLNSDSLDNIDSSVIQQESEHVNVASENVTLKSHVTRKKESRRISLSKELGALKVPAFEFSKSGSLRDWLLQGGQVSSPGSYITPKFGDFVSSKAMDGDIMLDRELFDPEMVSQFEQAMKQLTLEEEFILKQILAGLEGSSSGSVSGGSNTAEEMLA